ncbi:hypothetical protein [Shinella zoogloeoides]|uniref:Uncharacterized protein n=1 Tax=Shinella zoogloeoides TaxID=352475 RepID=A0A6N8TQ01_SHIZO|nr:hypothetical protein [Shinella zoogloeoides]MXO03140.1 hypothetical protein [Shinella zoogloeoides]UEX81867.1 hypothetical protein K8M09_00740 [Shinella zoogloeoides]
MTSKSTLKQRSERSCVAKLLKIRAKLATVGTLEAPQSRKYAVKIYRIVSRLSSDIDEWQTFCEHPEWASEKRKPQPGKHKGDPPLRFAIKFAVGFGPNASGSWVRTFNGLLLGAWSERLVSAKVDEHVKGIQEDKHTKAAAARDKRRENSTQTVKLTPSRFSKPLLAKEGEHYVKAELKITVQSGQKTVFEIAGLGRKALKSFGLLKLEKPKPAKKPTSAGK